MDTLIIKPEFFVDYDGMIHNNSLVIKEGHIVALGHDGYDDAKILNLPNQAILPGFFNCHSHVFQRALRGLMEQKILSANHFFTWRERMYAILKNLGNDELALLAQLTYMEMLEAGFTHVGEFHYLHHDLSLGKTPLASSQKLAEAAKKTQINLMLLECAYNRCDFDKPIEKNQHRFFFADPSDFLDLANQSYTNLNNENVSIGLAIHSVRAVPETWYKSIGQMAENLGMPLHIHVSEQQKDLDTSLSNTGLSPIGLLKKHDLLRKNTTLIHATHLLPSDLLLLKEHKPNICLCPSTEKNLGDGMALISDLFAADVNICLGTDQHVRLDPFCEARSIEEQERLRLEKRLVLGKPNGFLYEALLPCLTRGGMRSLYPTKDISFFKSPANLIAVKLPLEFSWHGPQQALDAMMLSYNPSAISYVFTNGNIVVKDGQHINNDKLYLANQLKDFFKKTCSI